MIGLLKLEQKFLNTILTLSLGARPMNVSVLNKKLFWAWIIYFSKNWTTLLNLIIKMNKELRQIIAIAFHRITSSNLRNLSRKIEEKSSLKWIHITDKLTDSVEQCSRDVPFVIWGEYLQYNPSNSTSQMFVKSIWRIISGVLIFDRIGYIEMKLMNLSAVKVYSRFMGFIAGMQEKAVQDAGKSSAGCS